MGKMVTNSTLVRGDVVQEKFQINGKWEWINGTVWCTRKNGKLVIKFDSGERYAYTVEQAARLPKLNTRKQFKPRKTRTKQWWEPTPHNRRKTQTQPMKPAKRLTAYDTLGKSDSLNKLMVRQALVSDVGPNNATLKALVLDAEDTKFSELLVRNHGVLPSNIDVPNCNGPDIVDAMNQRGYAVVHDSFLGDFVRSSLNKTYDLLFLDYCGTPGNPQQPNSPLHDVSELFSNAMVASGATVGVTVCLRNPSQTIVRHQNLHRISNAVVSAAFANGYVATLKMKTTYQDVGSQTMGFVAFRVFKLFN